MTELRVFPGGYKEGVWKHDRAYSDEEISAWNGIWVQLALETGDPKFLQLVWPLRGKRVLVRVK